MLPPLIVKKLEASVARHAELETLVSSPDVLANPPLYKTYSREFGTLSKVVGKFLEHRKLLKELTENAKHHPSGLLFGKPPKPNK